MRWTLAALLRPATFVLAIVAAVITGNRTDSFWFGLLAFFVAMSAGRVPRDADFDTWLDGYSRRALIGSVDEVAGRLREYERAGCQGVMLQHLLHADLEPVRLIGRLGQELV